MGAQGILEQDIAQAVGVLQHLRMAGMLTGTPGLIFGAAGIYTAFLYYGTLQEDVFHYKNSDGQKFTQAWFLQAFEAFANVLVGGLGMWLAAEYGPLKNATVTTTRKIFS